MTLAQTFAETLPDAFFLDPEQPSRLEAYLHAQGWVAPARTIVALSKAGEGNMNLTLRVELDDGTRHVVKQSRPWAEKFPSVPAPADRADIEALFYRQTASLDAIAQCSPRLLAHDPVSHLLLLEDLGLAGDLSTLYAGDRVIAISTLTDLADYLTALHGHFHRDRCDFYIENATMRALNAEHIFRFPFDPNNGFDLDAITPGLAQLGAQCVLDESLMAAIRALDARYRANGDTLLHGDFFPGSFLTSGSGVKVIDTEFCFFGEAEFDLGVLQAHLLLAQQPDEVIDSLFRRYQGAERFSRSLCDQYAGVELLRRLLGLAQLPLTLDLEQKRALVEQARLMLLRG